MLRRPCPELVEGQGATALRLSLRAVSVSRTAGKNGGSNVPHPFAGLYNSGKHSLPVRVLAVMPAGLVPFRIAFRSHGHTPTRSPTLKKRGWGTRTREGGSLL